MTISSITNIIKALNEGHIEYLIAGGLAVVAHGYLRFTADLDLILHLEKGNVEKAMKILKAEGFKPRAPIPIEDFANERERKKWVVKKNLAVFSLWSSVHKATEIDIFVEEPMNFDQAYKRKKKFSVEPGIEADVLSLDDLINLKKKAGRRKDLDDIENLNLISKKTNKNE